MTIEEKVLVSKATAVTLKLEHMRYMFSMNDIYTLVEQDWLTIDRIFDWMKNNEVPKGTNIISSIINEINNIE